MVQRSLTADLKKLDQDLDKIRDVFLQNIAEDLVRSSVPFVDTGAYITSHSITTTRGAGRSRTSHNKPRKQEPSAKATEALAQLGDDIAAIPKDQTVVYMTNNAPHANVVEYKHGYHVYGSVRNRSKLHLQAAINQVRGSQ
jgi:hypothetical protein